MTDVEKLKAALDYVHEIEFDGSDRCFATEVNFTYNLREKKGNSADLNLMLIKLLDKMDFTVYPVVLSTKDNGLLSPVNPSLRKLNYVLAYVQIDSNYVLVDATDTTPAPCRSELAIANSRYCLIIYSTDTYVKKKKPLTHLRSPIESAFPACILPVSVPLREKVPGNQV